MRTVVAWLFLVATGMGLWYLNATLVSLLVSLSVFDSLSFNKVFTYSILFFLLALLLTWVEMELLFPWLYKKIKRGRTSYE